MAIGGHKNRCSICERAKIPSKIKKKKTANPNLPPLMARRMVSCKKYEKTKNGYLMRTYRNMKSRVLGILKKKAHLYDGLPLMSKESFYAWSKQDPTFNQLFESWVNSGYNRKISPSIDRIDSHDGYTEGNIRWLTHSRNSQLGAESRFSSVISTLISAP